MIIKIGTYYFLKSKQNNPIPKRLSLQLLLHTVDCFMVPFSTTTLYTINN